MTAFREPEPKQTVNVAGGVGFFGLLALLFIGLKLGHVIDWPWYLVLGPLWGPFAAAAALILGFGLLVCVFYTIYFVARGLYRFCFK